MALLESALSGDRKIVMCIDDEPSCLRLYRLMLEDAGYETASFTDARSGLEYFSSTQVDLVILDYSMPGMDGGQAARAIRQLRPALPIIMLSCRPDCPLDAESWVDIYLTKGRDFDELPRSIERLLAANGHAA